MDKGNTAGLRRWYITWIWKFTVEFSTDFEFIGSIRK